MKKLFYFTFVSILSLSMIQCGQSSENGAQSNVVVKAEKDTLNGYASQEAWGHHLVTVSLCNNCHTPKKFTDKGMVLDSSRLLSGHPGDGPQMDIDRAMLQDKGMMASIDLTEWIGVWGTSYSANLTPDATGIGTWTEEQFFTALRKGKFKGMDSQRSLLPPMPWDKFKDFKDEEIRAIFAYLKSLPAVNNPVPAALPPANKEN